MKKFFVPLLDAMKEINPKGILVNEKFNSCIMGVGENYQGMILIYDENKVMSKLMETMIEEDAVNYFDTGILAENYGKYTPIFLINASTNIVL